MFYNSKNSYTFVLLKAPFIYMNRLLSLTVGLLELLIIYKVRKCVIV